MSDEDKKGVAEPDNSVSDPAVGQNVELDGEGKTVTGGLGSAAKYPFGVVGNMTIKSNAVDASVKPGKALGQSMLIGLGGFLGSMLLGNGLLGSLGFGLGFGVMGQEIKTVLGNVADGIKGNTPLTGRKFLTSVIPLVLSMVLSSKLGAGKAILSTILGGAIGSRVSNMVMGSNLGERYYGDEYIHAPRNREPANDEMVKRQSQEVERGVQARPEIEREQHMLDKDVQPDSLSTSRTAMQDSARTVRVGVMDSTAQKTTNSLKL